MSMFTRLTKELPFYGLDWITLGMCGVLVAWAGFAVWLYTHRFPRKRKL